MVMNIGPHAVRGMPPNGPFHFRYRVSPHDFPAARQFRLLPLLLLGILVLALVVGLVLLQSVKKQLVDGTGERLALVAAGIAEKFDRILYERYGDIRVMARAAVLQGHDAAAITSYLNDIQQAYSMYGWIGVADAAGRIIAATESEAVGRDCGAEPWFKAVLAGHGIDVRDVHRSSEMGDLPAIGFSAPIVGSDGKLRGVITSRVGLSKLEDIIGQTLVTLQAQQGTSARIEYQLINREGDLIVDSLLREELSVNLLAAGVLSAQLAASGPSGYVEEEHRRRHVAVVTGFARTKGYEDFPGFSWSILARMDRDDVLAPVLAVVWRVGLIGGSLFLPLVVSLIWLAVRLQRQWATVDRMAKQKAEVLATVEAFFVCVDAQGVVTEWTARAESLFRIALPAALGRPFAGLPIQWTWEPVLEALRRAGAEYKTIRLDKLRFTAPNGKERFLRVTVSPLFGDRSVDYILMGEDVTERLLIEHDLAQAQKLESIGRLAAGIAHEINTPIQFVGDNVRFLSESFRDVLQVVEQQRAVLGAVKGGACSAERIAACEAAAAAADLDYLAKEIPKSIEQSVEGIERVAKIVRAMKDFAHPGKNEKTAVDLNKAIESTVTVARNEWKYVADLELTLAPALPPVPCLAGEFNQVILNMIINAAHAIADVVRGTGRKGIITITTAQAGDCVEVRVADTGTGIPEAIRHKIFDPFFTTKAVGKGTGQGLAIARSVVADKHGGTIRVESDVGIGTTFIIRLPLHVPLPVADDRVMDAAA
jgi:signal transduction histidine kinase